MAQSIKRKRSGDNFTIISNDFLRDENLSLKAKGLLSYIMSLPDDWKIYFEELTEHSTDGEKTIRVAWKELEINGYARTTKIIDQKTKRVIEWTKEVSDFKKPDGKKPHVEKPDVAEPDVGNDRLLKTNNTKD
ncbi:helix-turn-helix domain-containing protein [Weissella soli]|uniref:helix-turn-helix domain-containing protein n=1 Tax=Weissella soli TaxID=155866 RepID=UPI003C718ECB